MSSSDAGNIRPPLTSLVGRRRALSQLTARLARSRLVTVTGVAGVGKSRLAVAVGLRKHAREQPGGAWIVELATVHDPRLLADAVGHALGVRADGAETIEAAIARRFRAAPALLVLDDCEHLLAGVRALVSELLRECPDLHVLATSREPLGLAGEATLSLAPLDLPTDPAGAAPCELLKYSAIELFVDRARAAEPGFRLTAENVRSVIEICRRLAGIPLGLELAAVRIRSMPLDALIDRLDDQLSLSNLAAQDDQRHTSLRAAIDVSHLLLSEAEQLLWRRLSIFTGDFTLASARAVATDGQLPPTTLFDVLNALGEKSIVTRTHEESDRFRLPEPIRLYGREKLHASGEEDELALRLRRWCEMIAAGSGRWWTGADQVRWNGQLRDEHVEIYAELDRRLRTDPESGLELVARIWQPFVLLGRARGIRPFIDGLLAHPGPPTRERAQVLVAATYIAVVENSCIAEGRAHGLASQTLSEQQGFERELGIAHYFLGLLELHELDTSAAHRHLESARRLLASSDAPLPYAGVLSSLACNFAADAEDSRRLIVESLEVLRRTQDVRTTALAHSRLGRIEWLLGDAESARESKRAALRLYRRVSGGFGIAGSVEELAWISVSLQEPDLAAQLLGAARSLREVLSSTIAANIFGYHRDADAQTRAALGDSRYRRMTERGATLTRPQAIALALGEDQQEAAAPSEQRDEWDLLTGRERQVAELVAGGASNPEIAATLSITRHTVKTHVQHILAKLDCQSRIDIAVWVARQDPNRTRRHLRSA
jgi:non-specific serine/threonine protein kinase